jgi:hypothetical protein
MDYYDKAELADVCALRCALDCGKRLNTAKEAVGNGKWKQWREQYLPKVSEETERLYRRLAKAVDKKEDVFCSCYSIRKAMEVLAKYNLKDMSLKPPREKKPPRQKESGSSAAGLGPPDADKPSGLEADLRCVAADEIIAAIDADKLADLAAKSIGKLSPDQLCVVLGDAWEADQLRDLYSRLGVRLGIAPHAPARAA